MIGDAEVLLDAQHAPRPQRSTRDSDALPSLDGRIQALEFQGPGTRPHGRACPRIAPPARDEDVERLRPQAHLRRPTSPGRAARAGLARLPCRSCSTWQVHGALGTALSARPQRVCWARRARCVGRHVGAAAQPRRRTARRPPPPSSGLSRRRNRPGPAPSRASSRALPSCAWRRTRAADIGSARHGRHASQYASYYGARQVLLSPVPAERALRRAGPGAPGPGFRFGRWLVTRQRSRVTVPTSGPAQSPRRPAAAASRPPPAPGRA